MAPLSVLLVLLSSAPALLSCGPPPPASASPAAAALLSPASSSKPPATSSRPVAVLSRTLTTSSPRPLATAAKTPAASPRPPGPSGSPPSRPSVTTRRPLTASTRLLPTSASKAPPASTTAKPLTVASPKPRAMPASFRSAMTSPTWPPPTDSSTTALSPTASGSSSPSPEQLVARIRALVRALRDADQLLRALQVFRDQQQIGDDAVLKVMMDDANRTLVQQAEHAVEKGTMAALMANLNAPGKQRLSSKVPYAAYGKKSAKFIRGQPVDSKPVAAVGKARSGVAAAAVASKKADAPRMSPASLAGSKPPTPSSSRTSITSAQGGTVVTRIKNDPILGEYKVVIRDLTPSASGGLAGSGAGAASPAAVRNDTDAKSLAAGASGTPPSSERGHYRFQDQVSAPSSTAPAPTGPTSSAAATAPSAPTAPTDTKAPTTSTALTNRTTLTAPSAPTAPTAAAVSKTPPSPSAPSRITSPTAPSANRRSGKAAGPKASSPRPKAAVKVASPNATITTATSKPGNPKKSLQKKASGDTRQVVVSATLHTAPPAEHEEAAARARSPLETPLLAGIFPRYGPGADLPQIEQPFVARPGPGPPVPPATALLPPFRDSETTTTAAPPSSGASPSPSAAPVTASPPPTAPSPPSTLFSVMSLASSAPPAARDNERSPGGGPRLEQLGPPLLPSLLDVHNGFLLGESPWIPIFVPPASANAIGSPDGPDSASPRTLIELTKLDVVEASPSPHGAQSRAVLNDALEWRPSRSWQYAVRQDRADANLQDLQHDNALGLQAQPAQTVGLLPLSLAESVYYRVRPPGLPDPLGPPGPGAGPYDGIPGVPGVDYPAYSRPPQTRFTCSELRPLRRRGYFADRASGCQAFYVCHGDGRGEGMLCPNGTIFSQELLVCDWWFNVDCK